MPIIEAGNAYVPMCIPLNWDNQGYEGDLGATLFGADFRQNSHFLDWGFDTNYAFEAPDYWVHLNDTPNGCECHNVTGYVSYCPDPTATPATGRCPMSDVTIRIEQQKLSGGWIYLKTTSTRFEPDDSGEMKAIFRCTLPGQGYYRIIPIAYDNAGLVTHVKCGSSEANPGYEIVAITELNLYEPIIVNEMVMCPVADPCDVDPDSMFFDRDFVPPHFQPEGMQPGRTYYTGLGGEQIDLFSGTMDLTAGIASLPGDGGFDFSIALHHNSRLYLDQNVGPWETWARQGQFGVGWELGLGKVILRSGSLPVILGPDGSSRVVYCTNAEYTMGPYVSEDGWTLLFDGGDSPTDPDVTATVTSDTGVTYVFQDVCKVPRGVCPHEDCSDFTYMWLVNTIQPAFAQSPLIRIVYQKHPDTMEYTIDGITHQFVREFYTISSIRHEFGLKSNIIMFNNEDSWYDDPNSLDPPPVTRELILNGTVIAQFGYSHEVEHHQLLETITRPADAGDAPLVDTFEYYTGNQPGDPISKLIRRHILPEGGAFEYIYKTETPQNRRYRDGGSVPILEHNATLNIIKATDGSRSEEITGSMVFAFVESPAAGMTATVSSHAAFEPSPENLLRTERYRFKSVANGASEQQMGLLTSYELIHPDQDQTVAMQTTYDIYDLRDLCQQYTHPCMQQRPAIRLLGKTTSTEFVDHTQSVPPGITPENRTIETSFGYQNHDPGAPWTTTNPVSIDRSEGDTLLSSVEYTWESGYLGQNLLRLPMTQRVKREGDEQVTTSYLYTGLPLGLPKEISTENLRTVLLYDPRGNVRKITNPDDTFMEYLWWEGSADLRVRLTDGKQTSITFDSVFRQPSEMLDINGGATAFEYDAIGRPKVVLPVVGAQITYDYRNVRTDEVTQSGMESKRQVDGLGRPDWVEYTADVGTGGKGRVVMRRDAYGRTQYASVPLTKVPTSHDDGFWVNLEFDVMGRPLRSKDPAGNVIRVAYQPGWVFQTDGNSNTTINKLDGNGRTVEVRLPANGDNYNETYYEYDLLGNLKHVMQYDREAGWQERFFEYDNLGRVIRETHPETGDTYYAYDPVTGRMTGTEAHDGSTRNITGYDELGRITSVDFASPSTSGIQTLQIRQHYDGDGLSGLISGDNLQGRMTALETLTEAGTTRETRLAWPDFDALGRNREKVLTVDDPDNPEDSVTLRLRYEYETGTVEELGRLLQVKYYDGADDSALLGTVQYEYRDGQDSLQSVTFQPVQGDPIGLLDSVIHHVTGSVMTLTRGNGITSEYEYDSAWRTDSIIHEQSPGGIPEPLFESRDYAYDGAHNITAIDETCLERRDQYTYDYDSWDRLKAVTGNIAGIVREEGFDYDSTGNMTHQTRVIDGEDQFDREYQYGSARGLLVFGGTDGTTDMGDTWRLKKDAEEWEAIEGSGPSARSDAAMMYDPYLDQTVLFGGVNQAGDVQGDTWVYEDGQWRNVELPSGPVARHGHEMVYLKGTRRIVMLGGERADGTPVNDMWIWRGSRWEQVSGDHPLNRTEFGAAALGANGILVFGGRDADPPHQALNDTWTYENGVWTELSIADGPAARYGHGMTWDASAGRVVLVGGTTDGTAMLTDTWVFLTESWYRLPDAESPASLGMSLVYDPDREAVVQFGGGESQGVANALWMLNNEGMWIEEDLDNRPPARREAAAVYLAGRSANRSNGGSTDTGKGAWSYRYDGRGNRIADAEFEYQYNAADRLVAINDRETKQELMRSVYDGTGKRVKVSEPGGPSVWTMYDGEVPMIERNEDGSVALHVYADGLHIARLTMPGSKDATDDPPGVEYYHSDHLGSPRLMTDQDGAVVWPSGKGASYWAYGGVMEDLAGDTDANRWRFTGKQEDESTGHHYFNARYLSESTKYNAPQFLSPDPVLGNAGDPRSWNRYAYCMGNPVNYVDSDGQFERRVTKFDAQYVNNDLLFIRQMLLGKNNNGISFQFLKAFYMHRGHGELDYKANSTIESFFTRSSSFTIEDCTGFKPYIGYFQTDHGVLDAAEYGNYLAGYTAGVIDYKNRNFVDQTGPAYFTMRCFGHLYGLFREDYTETVWDEGSIEYINVGYKDATDWMKTHYIRKKIIINTICEALARQLCLEKHQAINGIQIQR